MEVSTLCVVANNQSLIVLGALVVHHAAAELLCVCPDHLAVVTSSGVKAGDKKFYQFISDTEEYLHKGADVGTVKFGDLIIPENNNFTQNSRV